MRKPGSRVGLDQRWVLGTTIRIDDRLGWNRRRIAVSARPTNPAPGMPGSPGLELIPSAA
jgi:hypothetical protein